MPTSPQQKNATEMDVFRKICNIFKGADVGIGPYGQFFDRLTQKERCRSSAPFA